MFGEKPSDEFATVGRHRGVRPPLRHLFDLVDDVVNCGGQVCLKARRLCLKRGGKTRKVSGRHVIQEGLNVNHRNMVAVLDGAREFGFSATA